MSGKLTTEEIWYLMSAIQYDLSKGVSTISKGQLLLSIWDKLDKQHTEAGENER